MTVTWRLPHCAWCEEPIEEGADFVQEFGSEGDYYMHTECYAEYQKDQGRADAWAGEG